MPRTNTCRTTAERCQWMSNKSSAAHLVDAISTITSHNNSWYETAPGERRDKILPGAFAKERKTVPRPAYDLQDKYTKSRNPVAREGERYQYVDDCTDEIHRHDAVMRFSVPPIARSDPKAFNLLPDIRPPRPYNTLQTGMESLLVTQKSATGGTPLKGVCSPAAPGTCSDITDSLYHPHHRHYELSRRNYRKQGESCSFHQPARPGSISASQRFLLNGEPMKMASL